MSQEFPPPLAHKYQCHSEYARNTVHLTLFSVSSYGEDNQNKQPLGEWRLTHRDDLTGQRFRVLIHGEHVFFTGVNSNGDLSAKERTPDGQLWNRSDTPMPGELRICPDTSGKNSVFLLANYRKSNIPVTRDALECILRELHRASKDAGDTLFCTELRDTALKFDINLAELA